MATTHVPYLQRSRPEFNQNQSRMLSFLGSDISSHSVSIENSKFKGMAMKKESHVVIDTLA